MTSVVGILNKRGVAIAADSAVTRTRKGAQSKGKITTNGNKMVRLSDVDPITVMFTGNADFLHIPWDVIARKYRKERGRISQPTVEAAIQDFFDFISSAKVLWSKSVCDDFIESLIEKLFKDISKIYCKATQPSRGPVSVTRTILDYLTLISRRSSQLGVCPQFEDYSFDEFIISSLPIIDKCFCDRTAEVGSETEKSLFPQEVLDNIRPSFEHTLFKVLVSRLETNGSATLVFTGFGSVQEYPSLISVNVCEGFDYRVNYFFAPEDVVCISESNPVAICPFAQKDVIMSILRGVHDTWYEYATDEFLDLLNSFESDTLPQEWVDEDLGKEFKAMLQDIDMDDEFNKFFRKVTRTFDNNQRGWEKALEKYDLEAMASLADSLINLTAFHRILTFSLEGVGGLVDLGVISRNEGFTWLRRKSWYHKDVGGKDGGFGI